MKEWGIEVLGIKCVGVIMEIGDGDMGNVRGFKVVEYDWCGN
jgi:hypothetical protein